MVDSTISQRDGHALARRARVSASPDEPTA